MVISDLDGTLSTGDGNFHPRDLAAFKELGEQKVLRAIATGRSLHSATKYLPPDFPIDYLIFSSGAGVMKWDTKELLLTRSLDNQEVAEIVTVLVEEELDYMIHSPVPDTHHFSFYDRGRCLADFRDRCERQQPFSKRATYGVPFEGEATEVLVILAEATGEKMHNHLKARLAQYSLLRATSPLDKRSLWVEIFHRQVSKSQAARWLAARCQIEEQTVLAVGNDYNDVDLLHWAPTRFLVSNAAHALKQYFPCVGTVQEGGFSQAVERWRRRQRS